MKLLYCPDCGDIFRLTDTMRVCSCGSTSGKYIGRINAEYYSGVPIKIDDFSFLAAVENQPNYGVGQKFIAFIAPKNGVTMKKKSKENS